MPIIKASFFGPIKRPWPEHSRELELSEDCTVQKLLAGFGYTDSDMRRVAVVINGKRCGLEGVLRDGDDLRLVLLAGGG